MERVFAILELLLDLPHNTYEQLPDGGVIIRKSSVRPFLFCRKPFANFYNYEALIGYMGYPG